MLPTLPSPSTDKLPRSPLALVVCQVQFQTSVAVSDAHFGIMMHEALGGRKGDYSKLEPLHNQVLNIQVGQGGLPQVTAPQQSGWRLVSQDERWIASIMPNHVALETARYTTWVDFEHRLYNLLEATANHIMPTFEQRIGLRYVNRITEPAVRAPHEWRDYIVPELLGPTLHDKLGPGILSAQQQLDLVSEDGRCGLRHGFFADPANNGALTYLLDFDVYREGLQPFVLADIKDAVTAFNALVLRLFQLTITPKMYDFLSRNEG